MVLGYKDFWHLSEKKYLAEIRGMSTAELRSKEITKIRARFGSVYSGTKNVAVAHVTFGASLSISAVQARKWIVTHRKLKMVREELARRGQPLHEFEWKDALIPLTAFAAGSSLAGLLDVGLEQFVHISDVPTPLPDANEVDTGNLHADDGNAMLAQPQEALQGFGEGAMGQVEIIASGAPGTLTQHLGDLSVTPAGAPVDACATAAAVPGDLPARLAGAQLGALVAGGVEGETAEWIAADTTEAIIEATENSQAAHDGPRASCKRNTSTERVACNVCAKDINGGMYWHCCECCDDNFDVCDGCYKEGRRCNCKSSSLNRRQFSWPESSFNPKGRTLLEKSKNSKNIPCDLCNKQIVQGRFFECNDCSGGLTVCLTCYSHGGCCGSPEIHSLSSYVWAYTPSPALYPYPPGPPYCDKCKEEVVKGALYHCAECLAGHYDICESCYEAGQSCEKSTHVLQRFTNFNKS